MKMQKYFHGQCWLFQQNWTNILKNTLLSLWCHITDWNCHFFWHNILKPLFRPFFWCHLISQRAMGVKKAVEKLVVLVTWNTDGLAKRFSCKNWKEYLGMERGWDNKHEKLEMVCNWSCSKGIHKNISSYLIEEKLGILLFSSCTLIERWTSTGKYYISWRNRRQARRKQGDLQLIIYSAGNLKDLHRAEHEWSLEEHSPILHLL